VDLSSRLRAIVRSGSPGAARELTYEPDTGAYESSFSLTRVGELLGGRTVPTSFGECLAIDRRYESDRWHGDVRIGDCELSDCEGLDVLDPTLGANTAIGQPVGDGGPRTIFIDLETTGLSGGAGTVAFLVGCGYFDLGAFQIRQFLLTSYKAERALLAASADFFGAAALIVSYNGKTFDLPVMETRWVFHRMEMPLERTRHIDMLHAARRLWKAREAVEDDGDDGCRLGALERALFDVRRIGDVAGFEIPRRFFQFLRSGDPRPLEPVLEHNRMDLVSLAAVTARAVQLAKNGADACRDGSEALALGRMLERAGALDRAEACYRRAAASSAIETKAAALYRLGLRFRRERRFNEAAVFWRQLLELTHGTVARRNALLQGLKHFAAEALAVHHEHRARDYPRARELALFALDATADSRSCRRAEGVRHRLARLERKIARTTSPLFEC
jgi:tetratricopeptide (TPR) repeat protein